MGSIFSAYWDGLLNIPLGWVETYLHINMNAGWKVLAFKIACSIGLLLFCYEVFLRVKDRRRRKRYEKEEREAGRAASGMSGDERAEAKRNPELAVARLKKSGEYEKLGEVLSDLGRHKEAAKAYAKVGASKKAAMEWAKAGYPLKAARQMERAKDFGVAGKFYLEKKKYLKAAKAFARTDAAPQAADAYFMARRYTQSADLYESYFSGESGSGPEQLAAAESCGRLLEDKKAQEKVSKEKRKVLTAYCAKGMLAGNRPDVAGKLYQQVGELVNAGEAYLRAGQLEIAAKCMHQAGETKRASEIGGRYYEAKGQWKEAGMAYEGGGNFRKAGDCFSKANDAEKAGINYERAQEYYGAGIAMIHCKNWQGAVGMFQKMPEDHPNFGPSRGLLGHAFYELKEFAHSAATLENYLLNERVRKDNIDYFWMLALALEQVGKLEASQDVLLKIRAVNVEYRDVAARLSNVQSRISMAGPAGSNVGNMPTMATPASGNEKSPVMSMVEQSLQNRYELESELGRGGMGVVYKARDTQLDRPVALKFLGTLVDGSEEFRQRFKREAQAAAQVSHPNILSIYDIGVEQGSSYIAMEYIEGPNLNQYLKKKGTLDVREAVNLVGQALAALEAVHQAGIIHRDIKPDNILIAKGNLVKLMDFGLAKGHGANLTGSNVLMGTPCYMAPEQARGEEAGPRSDIYAMGLVLYELLTGKTVFESGNVLNRQITEMPPPPSSCVGGVPPELDAIIMKAISKKAEERFGSAQELLSALRQIGN